MCYNVICFNDDKRLLFCKLHFATKMSSLLQICCRESKSWSQNSGPLRMRWKSLLAGDRSTAKIKITFMKQAPRKIVGRTCKGILLERTTTVNAAINETIIANSWGKIWVISKNIMYTIRWNIFFSLYFTLLSWDTNLKTKQQQQKNEYLLNVFLVTFKWLKHL